MRLSASALAITLGALWGGCLLVVGLINLAAPSYAVDFLRMMGSVYPGFYHAHTIWTPILGAIYGFVDGAVGGWIFGCLYNLCVVPGKQSGATRLERAA